MTDTDPEPQVRAADVAAALRRRIVEGDPERAKIQAAIAERAGVSPETVKRVLRNHWELLDLDRADALLTACGGHISDCELVWP